MIGFPRRASDHRRDTAWITQLANTYRDEIEWARLGTHNPSMVWSDGFQMNAVASQMLMLEEMVAYLKARKWAVDCLAGKDQFHPPKPWMPCALLAPNWVGRSVNPREHKQEGLGGRNNFRHIANRRPFGKESREYC